MLYSNISRLYTKKNTMKNNAAVNNIKIFHFENLFTSFHHKFPFFNGQHQNKIRRDNRFPGSWRHSIEKKNYVIVFADCKTAVNRVYIIFYGLYFGVTTSDTILNTYLNINYSTNSHEQQKITRYIEYKQFFIFILGKIMD